MANNNNEQIILIEDLIEKIKLDESDLMIVEDDENTKKCTLKNFVNSITRDLESPTTYRLYSSQKIQDMIDQLSRETEISVGRAIDKVDNLMSRIITNDKFEEAIKDLDDRKIEEDSLVPLNDAIELRRLKTELIKSSDLDTSSEEFKLHLENLGTDIIDAMTGNTAISTARAPKGGWITEDISDGAITSTKLSSTYRFKGTIQVADVNSITSEGLYLLQKDVINVPREDEYDTSLRLLDVTRYGDNYISQNIYYITESDHFRPIYRRKGSVTRLHTIPFIAEYTITDEFKVTNDFLNDVYTDKGTLSDGNIYDITAEGSYYMLSTVTNLPTADDYMVEIRSYGDRLEYHAKSVKNDTCDIYISSKYIDNNYVEVITPWYNLNNTKRSKFDGVTVNIFGDDTTFGNGASDITNKSYVGILKNKYGVNVINHAISDATYGNYDDNNCSERSIIFQINSSNIESAEYIIIFAGMNDFRCGKSRIGKDDDMNDTTFKGSIRTALKCLYEKNTKAKIMLVTPYTIYSFIPGDGKNCDTHTINDNMLFEFSNAIKDIAKLYHIPCLDLFNTCCINEFNYETFLSNGLYLNDKGHEMIAEKIFNALCEFY